MKALIVTLVALFGFTATGFAVAAPTTVIAWKWNRIGIPETSPKPPGHGNYPPCQRPASQGCRK
jgi:hypothetical protein